MSTNPRDSASLNRAQASRLPDRAPGAVAPCPIPVKMVHAGVFFDGTNNNMFRDSKTGADTNIAKLHTLYAKQGGGPVIQDKTYIVGVGSADLGAIEKGLADEVTERVAEAKGALSKGAAYLTGSVSKSAAYWGAALGDLAGKAGGYGGEARLNAAFAFVSALCNSVPAEAEKTVDIFGFSRGAALARTFANLLAQGLMTRASNLRIRVVGIFDTVGSFGIAGDDSDPGQSLALPDRIDAVIHCCARHEYRDNFPLTSAPGADSWYVGAHSDVGGGYGPNDEGKVNHLALIPLVDVHATCCRLGVKLADVGSLIAERGVDLDALRAAADGWSGAAGDDASDSDRAFHARYVHHSASNRWNILSPNRAAWSGERKVFLPTPRILVGEPPNFSWE